MSDSPTITVLMPVYNGERYLREAVESVLNQTFTDFEFLIVNDGSTDASRTIICAYDDPRIRLIDNPANLGLTKSLNLGLQASLGQYVARQDADDISETERLAKQVNFMEANPQFSLLGTWYREIDAGGNFGDNVRLPSDQVELQWALLFYCPFVHSGVMLRKEVFLNQVGLYDETFLYAQDHELWLRTSRQALITNYPDYLVRYRLNPHSMTETYGGLTNEGVWLTIMVAASLLGWPQQEESANETRFRKMFNLLYGGEVDLTLAEIEQTTAIIWQLHQVFCQAYQLNQPEKERHRAKLQAWLSKRYVRIALGYATRDRHRDARLLYREGLHLHPPTLLTTKSARLLYRLLLVQPAKTFWSYRQSR